MSEDRGSELIELAAVVRSHGLRGELVLKPFNRDSSLFDELEHVSLKGRDGALRRFALESARPHGEHLLMALAGVTSREQADALRGSLVCIPRSELPEPEEGEYYLVDLVGLSVRDAQGQTIGAVHAIAEYPTVHCIVVEESEGTREVPILDRYLLQVDFTGGFVQVDHLDELELVARKTGV